MKKHRLAWVVAVIIAMAGTWHSAPAQVDPKTQQAFALYQQVISGSRTLSSLAPTERAQVLEVARLLRSSCSSNSHKCQAVCEAANQLDSAAQNLARCASRHDYSDSCDSQFNAARDAHDDFENAVTETDGDCD